MLSQKSDRYPEAGTVRATVMVVEDDPATRRLAARILTRARYEVIEAETVTEARSLWDSHHPQVALIDLALPGERGSVLLEESWVKTLETVVIVVTGSDDIDLADEAFEHGAYGYVVKPYTPNELLMQVSSALRRRHLERGAMDQVAELERKVIESGTGVGELRTRLEGITSESSFADEELIKRLASAVCLRDDETGRHIERVSLTAAALADWRGFNVDPTPAVRLAAAMAAQGCDLGDSQFRDHIEVNARAPALVSRRNKPSMLSNFRDASRGARASHAGRGPRR